jgi:hypothetical protein
MRALLLAALLPSLAWAGEARRIVVTPALPLEGEVLETTAEGFLVRVPQGDLLVPFELVEDLTNLEAVPASTPSWTVVVAGDGPRADAIRAAYGTLDGLSVRSPAGWDAAMGSKTAACGLDLDCLSAGVAENAEPTEWVFAAVPTPQTQGLVLETRLVAAGRGRSVPVALDDPAGDWTAAVRESLGLERSESGADAFAPKLSGILSELRNADRRIATPKTWTSRRVAALSFVPVPGLPSLLQKDYGTFGGALASSIALTAGWVGTTGFTSTDRGEHIALSVLGAYVSTVASNQVFGHIALRRRSPLVGVAPTFGPAGVDGAALTVHLPH